MIMGYNIDNIFTYVYVNCELLLELEILFRKGMSTSNSKQKHLDFTQNIY